RRAEMPTYPPEGPAETVRAHRGLQPSVRGARDQQGEDHGHPAQNPVAAGVVPGRDRERQQDDDRPVPEVDPVGALSDPLHRGQSEQPLEYPGRAEDRGDEHGTEQSGEQDPAPEGERRRLVQSEHEEHEDRERTEGGGVTPTLPRGRPEEAAWLAPPERQRDADQQGEGVG